jgi:predicted DNA-binding ribbon-helix-helix protein
VLDLGMRLDRRFHNPPIKSLVLKQSVSIKGRDSSVSIEGAFWSAFKAIAVASEIARAGWRV